MNLCVLLLPGALLPAPIAREVLRAAPNPPFARWLAGAARPTRATLVETEALSHAAHLAWLWRAFAQRGGVPVTAPYTWAAAGGPTLATEVWRARPCHLALSRDHLLLNSLDAAPPTADEIAARSPALRAAAAEAGFQLQELDGHWFLTRKTPWDVAVRPWESQLGATVGPESATGPAALAWRKLLNEVQMAWHVADLDAAREAAGQPSINGVWVDGGGRWERLPPSSFRSLLADSAAVRGWGLAAGLPSTQVRPVQDDWPAVSDPEYPGDRLAVLDDLAQAHRDDDWGAWLAALPALEARIERLATSALAQGAGEVRLVATGREQAACLSITAPGWRFWRRWQTQDAADWLSEDLGSEEQA